MEELLNEGCPKHTYLDKDGRCKPAHPLIECQEFLRLNQALQEKMRPEQPIAGDIAFNASPPPPNPPSNATQHGHQAAMIQHLIKPRQQAVEEEAFPPPRGYVPMIQRGCPTNRIQRKRGREVFQAEHASPASPEYLN
jgi:hypothetical protein